VRAQNPAVAAWICVALFACVALPLIVSNYDHGRAYYDQATYHYPAIRHFLAGGDFRDYSSATTPGFHLLMAAMARALSDSEIALKLVNLLITAILIGLVTLRVTRTVSDRLVAVFLVLPLLFSIYFLPSGVWLLPDNLAWLSVFCTLALVQDYRDRGLWYLLVCVTLTVAVLVRQSNIWLCVVPCVIAIGHPDRLFRIGLAILPCVGVLLYFLVLWHGTVPPSFAEKHAAVNFAAVPYFLAVVGFYGMFYLTVIWVPLRNWLQSGRVMRLLACGALVGFAVGISSATEWSPDAGRVSGLWNLAKLLPSIAHRSLLITLLSTLGGLVGTILLTLAVPRQRLIAIAAALGFVAAQSISHFVYERYYAGLVFFLVIMLVADIRASAFPSAPAARPIALAGPAVFTVLNACVLAGGLL
jgi:hypothetical protein